MARDRTDRPRVLQVVHTFPPDSYTGTEVHTLELSRALIRGGLAEVQVFHPRLAPGPPGSVRSESWDGIPVHRAIHGNELRPDENPIIERAFRDVLDLVQPNLVHFQHCAWGGEPLPAVTANQGIPSVLTLHDYWGICPRFTLFTVNGAGCSGPGETGEKCVKVCWLDAPGNRGRRRTARAFDRLTGRRFPTRGPLAALERGRLYERSWVGRPVRMQTFLDRPDRLIAPSEYVKKRYTASGVPSGRIVHVPHGIETAWAQTVRRAPSDRVRFGYVGTALPHKGLEILVEAFSALDPGSAELLVYADLGDAENLYARTITERLRDMPNVMVRGKFRREAMAEVYGSFDVLVVPSVWDEVAGLVILEARAAGAAVVVSKAGGMSELVRDGEDGFIVPPGSPEALREILDRFVDTPALAMHLAARSDPPRPVDDCARDTADVYRSVLG